MWLSYHISVDNLKGLQFSKISKLFSSCYFFINLLLEYLLQALYYVDFKAMYTYRNSRRKPILGSSLTSILYMMSPWDIADSCKLVFIHFYQYKERMLTLTFMILGTKRQSYQLFSARQFGGPLRFPVQSYCLVGFLPQPGPKGPGELTFCCWNWHA